MRLLCSGHTYLADENQKKLAAMVRHGGVELDVVVPHMWRDMVLGTIYPHINPEARHRSRGHRSPKQNRPRPETVAQYREAESP